jgi:hypothetical protein
MPDTKTLAQTTSVPRAKHRRIKRGIVASYIHQISERHNDDALRKERAVVAPAQEKVA